MVTEPASELEFRRFCHALELDRDDDSVPLLLLDETGGDVTGGDATGGFLF